MGSLKAFARYYACPRYRLLETHHLCSFLTVGEDCVLPVVTPESAWMVTPSSLSSDDGVVTDASALDLARELAAASAGSEAVVVVLSTRDTCLLTSASSVHANHATLGTGDNLAESVNEHDRLSKRELSTHPSAPGWE